MIDKNKLSLLHSIRGVAAFVVVICHAKFAFWSGGSEYRAMYPVENWSLGDYLFFAIDMFTSNGTSMVILFFVLSGFFISYSFNKNEWTYTDFYINRFLRIYIPYFASIVFSVVTIILANKIAPSLFSSEVISREYNQGIFNAYQNLWTMSSLSTFFFMLGDKGYIGYNYPYWSLLIEVLFYMSVPFIIYRKKIFYFTSVIALLFSFLFDFSNPILKYIFNYSFYFAVGFALFHYLVLKKVKFNFAVKNIYIYNVIASLLILFGQFIGLIDGVGKFSYLFTVAGGCIFIYRIINFPVKSGMLISLLKSLGKISFSMYLIHVPFFIVMYSVFVKYSGLYYTYNRIYWLAVLLCVPVSYLFYYLVEGKSLKLISMFKEYVKSKKTKANA